VLIFVACAQTVLELKTQISVILSYVAKSGAACEVKKVFLGFDDVSRYRRALLHFFSWPTCFHLFIFVYFTRRSANII